MQSCHGANLSHDTIPEFLSAFVLVFLAFARILAGELHFFRDQSLLVSVTFELNVYTNFEKLTANKIGLVNQYIRTFSVF